MPLVCRCSGMTLTPAWCYAPGAPPEPLVEALLERLRELGYREGRDIVFELRWAQGKNERLTELASELVAAKVDVITTISTPAALAARKATTTIPIVFTGVGDPARRMMPRPSWA